MQKKNLYIIKMIPFLNMGFYQTSYKNMSAYVEKMNKGELTLEQILDEDDLVQELKISNSSFRSL